MGKILRKDYLYRVQKVEIMASIRPILKSKGETTKIYIRFRNGTKHDYTLTTNFTVNSKDWNKKTNRPKLVTAETKLLKSDLDALCSKIQNELNKISLVGLEPSKLWLDKIYNNFTNNETKEQNAEISYWINFIAENPHLFENSIGEKGLSKNRVKQYKLLLNVFNLYQGKHKYKIIEIDQFFYDSFFSWLRTERAYKHSTSKKFADDIVATANHARRFKIPVSNELSFIKRPKDKKTEPIVIEEHEIQQIINADLKKPYLENARKWFLLGLQLAQRVSDLLPISENNIQYVNNLDGELVKCLVFNQKKSKETKEIVIPFDEELEEALKNGFPTKISAQRFNEYIKEVCKIAGMDSLKSGEITTIISINNGEQVKRKKAGVFSKYQLITSHTLRKTATTHYYQVSGAKVKSITGHSKEETVNLYVNEERSRKLSQVQEIRKQKKLIEEKKKALKQEHIKTQKSRLSVVN